VTLDDDLAARLKQLARERGISFKEALNRAIRAGLRSDPKAKRGYRTPTRALTLRPGVELTKALALAAAMEDEELIRKLELRK